MKPSQKKRKQKKEKKKKKNRGKGETNNLIFEKLKKEEAAEPRRSRLHAAK